MEISINLFPNIPQSNISAWSTSAEWKNALLDFTFAFETKLDSLTGGCGQIGQNDLIQPPMKKCIAATLFVGH